MFDQFGNEFIWYRIPLDDAGDREREGQRVDDVEFDRRVGVRRNADESDSGANGGRSDEAVDDSRGSR